MMDLNLENFEILHWWYDHKLAYSVLSILTRDVLTVFISTISFESAFSLSERIFEKSVEILLIVKD